ncbi:MAG TPA: LamG-like jellyroll fold domain-containing protein [Armatimonadota bacterium]|nr:LamG-like jellyroll fold domain-containing protein [Armatimonadota bacterium]
MSDTCHVSAPASALETPTITFWCVVRTLTSQNTTHGSNTLPQIILRGMYSAGTNGNNSSACTNMWGVQVTGGNFGFWARDYGGNGMTSSVPDTDPSKFHSLCGIWDNLKIYSYVDGTAGSVGNAVYGVVAKPSMSKGIALNGQGFMDGNIAEVIVFGRVLSDKERILVDNYINDKYQLYGSYNQPAQTETW